MRRTARAALTEAEAKKIKKAALTPDGWKLLRALGLAAHEAGRTLDASAAVALLHSLGPLTEGRRETAAAPDAERHGMTIQQAGQYLGVDRRRLPRALVEIPPGPVPPLPPGRVPARRIGNTLRIFPQDLLGLSRPAEESHDAREVDQEAAPTGPAARPPWHRPLCELLERRA